MTHAASGTRPAGFTLLEVLVALVVLGLLMVGLTQGVRTGLALRQAQVHRLDALAETGSVMRLLRTLLSRLPVMPDGNTLVATAAGAAFRGEADRVSFVGDMPTGLGTTRRAEMTLSVVDQRLTLSWVPHLHERLLTALPPATQTVLLGGVERLDLAYWGSLAAGQPQAWQTRWESAEAPELIRLRLRFAKGDRRRWPDLIVAPRLD